MKDWNTIIHCGKCGAAVCKEIEVPVWNNEKKLLLLNGMLYCAECAPLEKVAWNGELARLREGLR